MTLEGEHTLAHQEQKRRLHALGDRLTKLLLLLFGKPITWIRVMLHWFTSCLMGIELRWLRGDDVGADLDQSERIMGLFEGYFERHKND